MTLREKIISLINASNTATGSTDTDLTSAVSRLCNGYGGGGSTVTKKDVNFYDYDGTIVSSYTTQEFAALTAMPDNPSHTGLTAQGWNWSLSDAKTYVAKYGKLNIGQMYITSDGKTRLYIELTEGRLSPWLKLYLNANSELDIDWGDGSTHSTFTTTSEAYKNEQHTYATAGSYVIAITVVSGVFSIRSSSTSLSTLLTNDNASTSSPDRGYLNSIKKIEIGNSITSIGAYAFASCYSLASITIPNTVKSIGAYAFASCYSLASITIPNSVASILGNAFANCYSLASITIPNTVKSIGTNTFASCYSLASITIPNSVASILGNAFANCSSLASITIPDSVTSIETYAFYNCSSLASITIPNSVTSIGSSALGSCGYMEFCRFNPVLPPTVSNSNAFSSFNADRTKIYCPSESLSAYKSATNYPNPATFTYIGFATYESGTTLPVQTQDEQYNYTWYATVDDLVNSQNPITQGNGSEVYAIITAV